MTPFNTLEGCPFSTTGKKLVMPEGRCLNGVLILGEAPGEMENVFGTPFVKSAPAGSVLERAIRKVGATREEFVLFNTVPVQPPHNFLEGAKYEDEAVAWGTQFVEDVVKRYRPRAILALGNIALRGCTGMAGKYRNVGALRGYVLPSKYGVPVVGSFHPSFLRRGAMGLFSVLMHDIKLALAVAGGVEGRFFSPVLWRDFIYRPRPLLDPNEPIVPAGYVTHPSESDAWAFLHHVERHPECMVSYDIETPRSAASTEDESDELEDKIILSIQLSAAPETGIFMPWREPFVQVAKSVLALGNAKVGANTWRFDDPLLAAHGCPVAGVKHDVRWLWHHLQPDMKANLQFIASFYPPLSPNMPHVPWKHWHEAHPAAYGIMDVDVLQRIMEDQYAIRQVYKNE